MWNSRSDRNIGPVPNFKKERPHRGLSPIVVAGVDRLPNSNPSNTGSVPSQCLSHIGRQSPTWGLFPIGIAFGGQVRSRTFWCGKLPSDRTIGPVSNFTKLRARK
jgi:hypothetical protein